MEDFITSVNQALSKETKANITLTFDKRTKKVKVHVQNGYYVAFQGKLSILLGFGGNDIKISKTTISPYVGDITASINTIYVYCDIVQPQVVGDANVKLLRSVPIDGEVGKVVTRNYNNVQYVPVQTKTFGDIEILLRDDTGNPLSFEHGKVLVTLHFQRTGSYFA